MVYLEVFLLTNIFTLFILTIYILFFYFKYNYINYKRNLYEELFVLTNIFLLIFLYFKFNTNLYIFYLSINILLLLQFNNIKLTIFTIIWYIALTYYLNINHLIILYISYLIAFFICKRFNKTKLFYTNTFVIISIIYMLFYIYFNNMINTSSILLIIIYIISIYIITFYTIFLKKRIKLYLTIKDIEKDKAFKTSIFKVTHEIKNPLAVIKGYLSIFDSNDKDKCERYKNILECEVNNALLVLKDFNELNNMKIVKDYMCFNNLLLEVKNTIIPFLTTKRINLKIDSEKDIYIYADYNRLKQVLINVLKNACEALDNNGKININSYQSNNKLIINIKDNGCGMTKETIDNLFTPFYSKKSSGTGLGLCLSKEIIENHGGYIKYSSVLNKYTLVKIMIPVS